MLVLRIRNRSRTCERRDDERGGCGEEEGARAHDVAAHGVHGPRGEVDEPRQVAGRGARGRRSRCRRGRPGARFNSCSLKNGLKFLFDVKIVQIVA